MATTSPSGAAARVEGLTAPAAAGAVDELRGHVLALEERFDELAEQQTGVREQLGAQLDLLNRLVTQPAAGVPSGAPTPGISGAYVTYPDLIALEARIREEQGRAIKAASAEQLEALAALAETVKTLERPAGKPAKANANRANAARDSADDELGDFADEARQLAEAKRKAKGDAAPQLPKPKRGILDRLFDVPVLVDGRIDEQ